METTERIYEVYTNDDFKTVLKSLGIESGDTLVVHTKMSSLPYIIGAQRTVVEGLLEVLGEEGTLLMPAQNTYNNGDPKFWENPPVDEKLHQKIRDHFPPFNFFAPLKKMGKVAEYFHNLPGVLRSPQTSVSFIGCGPKAEAILKTKTTSGFREGSVVENITNANAKILLLGVDYDNCTTLHYAQTKSEVYVNKNRETGVYATSTIVVEMQDKELILSRDLPYGIDMTKPTTKVIEKEAIGYNSDIFTHIGAAYETAEYPYRVVDFGKGKIKLLPAKDLVEFGVQWLEANYMEYWEKESQESACSLDEINIK